VSLKTRRRGKRSGRTEKGKEGIRDLRPGGNSNRLPVLVKRDIKGGKKKPSRKNAEPNRTKMVCRRGEDPRGNTGRLHVQAGSKMKKFVAGKTSRGKKRYSENGKGA